MTWSTASRPFDASPTTWKCLALEQRPHALADEPMVVGKHDADRHDGVLLSES